VRRIEEELGRSAYVIGTGGLCGVIAPETTSIHALEPLLTLEGLALLYRRATGALPVIWV
jgi:type III pantothenate kinase